MKTSIIPTPRRLALACAIILIVASAPLLGGEGETMKLDRVVDHMIVAGKDLATTKGREIGKLRLLAFKGGKLEAIPFQIDERDRQDGYVLRRLDGKQDQDPDPAFDANDELIFMAKDAGDRGDLKAAAPTAAGFDELTLADAKTGAKGWAYLAAFDQDPPPLSPVSYMKYQEKADLDELVTPDYTLHFPKNDVFMSDMIISKEAGGNGKDIMDRIKMRSAVDMLSVVSIDKTEKDFSHKVLGVRIGPVRVIRQTETRISLVMGLKSPAAVVNGSFYPCCFQFPSVLAMPFRMDLIAKDAYLRQGWDLNRNAIGTKIYTNLNPTTPVVMDGVMSPEEKTLAANRETLLWALGTGPAGTFIFEGVWDRSNSPIKALLYYEDDLSKSDPPEEDPGIMGIAYRLEDILKMGDKSYPFNIVNYTIPNFDGDVEKARRVFDQPLEVKVNVK